MQMPAHRAHTAVKVSTEQCGTDHVSGQMAFQGALELALLPV